MRSAERGARAGPIAEGAGGPMTSVAFRPGGAAMLDPISDAPALLALVDDDPTFVRAMLRDLGAMGFRVRGFTRPEAALRFLCEHDDERADAVITDHEMPGLTGSELCTAVREANGASAPPFILLTGSADALDPRERALFDLVLAKPCTGERLLAAIAEVSRRRASMTPPPSAS